MDFTKSKTMFEVDQLPYYDPSKERKVVLVTGGNSGIGWYTVLHLYIHGFITYIAARNITQIRKAIKDIKQEAHRRKRISNLDKETLEERVLGEIRYFIIDLSDLSSVERGVRKFMELEEKLDVIINNAGVISLPYQLSVDGLEIHMQTNYLSHFLLTMRLLPHLKKCSGRIIMLSSIVHKLQFRHFEMDQHFNYTPNILFAWMRYIISKTASIQFTKILAIKNPDVLCMSIHPGLVMNTNLFSYWTHLPIVGIIFWIFFHFIGFFFGVSNEEGAISSLKCAMSPSITIDKDNGKYYTTKGVKSKTSQLANDLDYAVTTWFWSVKKLRDRGFYV